jgi:cell division protein ZapE
VLVLEGGRDFRRERLHGMPTWHVPAGRGRVPRARRGIRELARCCAWPAHPELLVMGRAFLLPHAAGRVARFDFATLCGTALGAGDYLALATHFDAVVLDAIPALGPDNFDEARRFTVLVDALYEHRVKLVASAAAPPDGLYPSGDGTRAFQRTASRLQEMQSQDYLELAHLT